MMPRDPRGAGARHLWARSDFRRARNASSLMLTRVSATGLTRCEAGFCDDVDHARAAIRRQSVEHCALCPMISSVRRRPAALRWARSRDLRQCMAIERAEPEPTLHPGDGMAGAARSGNVGSGTRSPSRAPGLRSARETTPRGRCFAQTALGRRGRRPPLVPSLLRQSPVEIRAGQGAPDLRAAA